MIYKTTSTAILLGLSMSVLPSTAIAQSQCGNFWVNPSSGQTECLDHLSVPPAPTTTAPSSPVAPTADAVPLVPKTEPSADATDNRPTSLTSLDPIPLGGTESAQSPTQTLPSNQSTANNGNTTGVNTTTFGEVVSPDTTTTNSTGSSTATTNETEQPSDTTAVRGRVIISPNGERTGIIREDGLILNPAGEVTGMITEDGLIISPSNGTTNAIVTNEGTIILPNGETAGIVSDDGLMVLPTTRRIDEIPGSRRGGRSQTYPYRR
jgi:hypothetical protein